MNLHDHRSALEQQVFAMLRKAVGGSGQRAFVIGGFVRDTLLGKSCKDIDIVSEGSGIELAKAVSKVRGASDVKIFKTYGTAMLRYRGWEIEFVGARKESYTEDSRKPSVVKGTLQDDQLRRDFTINTLALSLNDVNFGELIDPFNGIEDLKNGLIKTPTDSEITFSDDPLRMMRAIRFATQLNFTLNPNALSAIKAMASRIAIVSMERITVELNKIIASEKPSIGFKLLFDTGLLAIIFPEMAALQGVEKVKGRSHKDNFYHTLEVLDNVSELSENLWLRWAAILHDIAKPATKRYDEGVGWTFHGHEDRGARMTPGIFKRMKLPLDAKMKYVQKLVALHLRPIALTKEEATDSAIRRLLFDAGDAIDDLMLLCKSDITSKNESKVKRYLANYELVKLKLVDVEEKDRIRNWQPPISGEHIMETFGISPSREVGIIKNSIKEAILDGEIHNSFEEARAYMLSEGARLGLELAAK